MARKPEQENEPIEGTKTTVISDPIDIRQPMETSEPKYNINTIIVSEPHVSIKTK